MNLLAMTQRLYRESGRSGTAPTTLVGASNVVQRLADAISDSWDSLQLEPQNWRWMRASADVSTVAGEWLHSAATLLLTDHMNWRLPSLNYTVRACDPAAPTVVWDLTWMEPDWFKREFIDASTEEAAPRYWSIDSANNLLIGPMGDQSYTLKLDYIKAPTTLADDTNEPDMPSRHHMILVWRALADSGKDSASPEKVSRAIDRLRDMRGALLNDQAEQFTLHIEPIC